MRKRKTLFSKINGLNAARPGARLPLSLASVARTVVGTTVKTELLYPYSLLSTDTQSASADLPPCSVLFEIFTRLRCLNERHLKIILYKVMGRFNSVVDIYSIGRILLPKIHHSNFALSLKRTVITRTLEMAGPKISN